MTIDFSNSPNPADTESPMFAPIPAWERGKKRRSDGSTSPQSVDTVAAEGRSFAPSAPVSSRTDFADPATSTFAAAPAYATRTTVRKRSAAPLIVGAGIILVAGLAAAGWYATQPATQGVAELTPGSATTTTTTTPAPAPAAAATPAPRQLAISTASPAPPAIRPAATHTITTTTTHAAPTPRNPVAGATARAVLPAGPQAYAATASTLPPTSPTTPAFHGLATALTPAPVQSAPAAEVPAPAATSPAPTETAPQ